jgi:hypothetical protein
MLARHVEGSEKAGSQCSGLLLLAGMWDVKDSPRVKCAMFLGKTTFCIFVRTVSCRGCVESIDLILVINDTFSVSRDMQCQVGIMKRNERNGSLPVLRNYPSSFGVVEKITLALSSRDPRPASPRYEASSFLILFKKLNILQKYDIARNYRILHRVVQRLSQRNLKISKHCYIYKLYQIK